MNDYTKNYLRNLLYLRNFAPIFSDQVIFIFGCQRSGNTLLLSILNAHPQLTCIDETELPGSFPFPSAQRLAIARMRGKYICLKILEHSNKINFLKRFYPNTKILWPIRNPYDTIGSMLNLVNSKGNWIDRCAKVEIDRLKPFFNIDEIDLTNRDIESFSPVELGAIYWKYKNMYPDILEKNGFSLYKLQYEKLLRNPEEILRNIVNFLGIEPNDNLLEFHRVNPPKTLAGGTRTDRPLDRTKVNNNIKDLSQRDLEIINRICEPVMRDYNYPLIETIPPN